MTAFMIVSMAIDDDGWMTDYFAAVPAILADHGGQPLAGSRAIRRIEGKGKAPDRMAVFTFPSLAAIDAFMADPRYRPFLEARTAATISDICAFENELRGPELV